jgi:hypothetical protein
VRRLAVGLACLAALAVPASASVYGVLSRRTATGFLRLRTNTFHRRGKCDSGRLRWRARFVPRLG